MTQLEKASGTQRSFDDAASMASATPPAVTAASGPSSGGEGSDVTYHVLAPSAPLTDDLGSAGALSSSSAATFAGTETVTHSTNSSGGGEGMDGGSEEGVREGRQAGEQGEGEKNCLAAPSVRNPLPGGGDGEGGRHVAVVAMNSGAQETGGPASPDGGIDLEGVTGVPRGMGAGPRTSMARKSSGDLMAMAAAHTAAEGRGGGESRGLGGRGGAGGGSSGNSPSTTRAGPFPASLPRTPDFNHNFSPSGVRRGCAETPSPQPRLSLPPTPAAAAAAAITSRSVRPAESSSSRIDGRTGAVTGAAEPGVSSSRPPLPREEGGRGSAAGVSRGHPPLAPSTSASTPASPSPPVTTASSNADGYPRAVVRDYGPGIPVTRIASWSTFGDEGGGTILGYDDHADAAGSAAAAEREGARNGGGGGGGGGSQDGQGFDSVPLSEETGEPGSLESGRRRRLGGGVERGSEDSEQQPGLERRERGQGSPPATNWATNNRNGKASFVSEEDRAIDAAQGGDIAAMKAFLDNGGDIELRDARIGMTLLAWASRMGHTELAKLLLSRGALVQAGDGKNRTPLHRACTGCNADVVKVLLDHGADPNAKDQTWRTPLHRAARWGSPECSTLLLDAGGDIEARDKELARTPLHFASRSGGLETTVILLNNGAKINAKTVAGNTPLHLACDRGLVGNVKLLLEWGADVTARNEAGALPADVAAPWVEDSVKATLQELLTPKERSSEDDPDALSTKGHPQPAVHRPRPEGAAEKEVGLMDFIRSQRDTMAECPECQQDMLRQTHTFTNNGVPVGLSSTHGGSSLGSNKHTDSLRSSGKLRVCSTHRARAQPGEGGLPGLTDDRDTFGEDFGHGIGIGIGIGSIRDDPGGDDFLPRRGMGKSRKQQLSSSTVRKYESQCCSVQ